MNVAILLAGPSLAKLTAAPDADLLIGVKRAALRFPCDWCVVLDIPCLRSDWFRQVDAEQYLTRRDYRPKYTTRPGVTCEEMELVYPPSTKAKHWNMFSSSASLVLAKFLGAKRIDVYGADFGQAENDAEFDGYRSPEARYTTDRWELERSVWDETTRLIGIEVTRHGLDG